MIFSSLLKLRTLRLPEEAPISLSGAAIAMAGPSSISQDYTCSLEDFLWILFPPSQWSRTQLSHPFLQGRCRGHPQEGHRQR